MPKVGAEDGSRLKTKLRRDLFKVTARIKWLGWDFLDHDPLSVETRLKFFIAFINLNIMVSFFGSQSNMGRNPKKTRS
jgi:hypothetical protein